MKIEISNAHSIGEIKDKFNKRFPFLQLEFFSGTTESGFPNPLQRILDTSKKLESKNCTFSAGEISISGNDKVATIEKEFLKTFGLFVQVFRKSGNSWLLTTITDDFTLDHQNEIGKEMSTAISAAEPEDIHEQE